MKYPFEISFWPFVMNPLLNWIRSWKADQGRYDSELRQFYVENLNFGLFQKLLYIFARLSYGSLILAILYFGESLPDKVVWVIVLPFFVFVIATFPKYYALIWDDKKLGWDLLYHPHWGKCFFLALKPTEAESKKYPLFPIMYYISRVFLISCVVIFVGLVVIALIAI